MPAHPDFRTAVLRTVARVRPGDVVSYGEVARLAGHPGAARAVGSVLRQADGLPWWRVVHADGGLVGRLAARQAARLRAEGVRCQGGRVVRGDPTGATATGSSVTRATPAHVRERTGAPFVAIARPSAPDDHA